MGRYQTLNPQTQDQVDAMLPAIAKAFNISEAGLKDIIPEDIRMRAWDTDRRDHIKDKTEDDPRNWGVQFLMNLQAIARLLKGDLTTFQEDLIIKCEKHEEKHPWCRLADIRALKAKYENPGMQSEDDRSQNHYSSERSSSTDSYLQELVEREPSKGRKRKYSRYENVEAQVQGSSKAVAKKRRKQKPKRLRRDVSAGWDRREKDRRHSRTGGQSARYSSVAIKSEKADSIEYASYQHSDDESSEPLAVQRLQAELEVAEAELKYARLRHRYLAAKEEAQARSGFAGAGTEDLPHHIMD